MEEEKETEKLPFFLISLMENEKKKEKEIVIFCATLENF
jgi:hypothetical protein